MHHRPVRRSGRYPDVGGRVGPDARDPPGERQAQRVPASREVDDHQSAASFVTVDGDCHPPCASITPPAFMDALRGARVAA